MAANVTPSRDSSAPTPGPLALVGGDEFRPGNEPQDELLVRAAGAAKPDTPAFVIVSAAVRHEPDRAVATARAWFAGLGLEVAELPLRTRGQARDRGIVALAASGGFFYLAGGDPGQVVRILERSRAWEAIVDAWRRGAVLAGSSAGAMAFGSWTLVRARYPGDARRDARPALGLVPGLAIVPHFETFGHRWVPEAREPIAEAGGVLLGLDERTAAIWQDGEWRAHGAGAVTVIARDERRSASGQPIEGLPSPMTGM
jgi:cyanophycinase